MTTRDFIERTYNTKGNDRHCSSVFTDSGGYVYSYGYHYPLAFHVGGLDFINNAGYSNTTSKHIGWAWSALNYKAVAVKLNRDDARVIASSATDETKLDTIKRSLIREYEQLTDEIHRKTRKDTQVYRHLVDEQDRVASSLNKVLKAMEVA